MSAVGLGVVEGCKDIRVFLEDWTEPYEGFEQELEMVRDRIARARAYLDRAEALKAVGLEEETSGGVSGEEVP
jgi:hypothetical protein